MGTVYQFPQMSFKFFKMFSRKLITVSLITVSLVFISISKNDYSITSLTNNEENFHELEMRISGPVDHEDSDLVRYLLQHVLIPPATGSYNLSSDPTYKATKHRYNWKAIHSCLKSLFSDTRDGFFVEAGALDGEFLSNSLWLEQNLSWKGLLVEPEDSNYRNMVWKRRKSWLSHSCLSNEKYPKSVTMVSSRRAKDSSTPPWVVWGASFQKSYLSLTESGPNKIFYKLTDSVYYNSQCFPLYSLMLALNVSVIDFLSLDIQGAELDVFNTIPLDKIYLRSIVIEDNQIKANIKLIKHFNNLGFDLFAANSAGPDYFFINRNDSNLMKKANELVMGQRLIDEGKHFDLPDIPFGRQSI